MHQKHLPTTVDMLIEFFQQLNMTYDTTTCCYYTVNERGSKLWFKMNYIATLSLFNLLGLYFELNKLPFPDDDSAEYVAQYLNLPEPLIYECFYCYSQLDDLDFQYHVNRTLKVLNNYKLTGEI